MTVTELQVGIFEFVRKEVIPHLEGVSIPLFGNLRLPISKELMQVGLGTATAMAELDLERFIPQMQMLGIVTSDGNVDIERLIPILKEEVKRVEKLKIGAFTFEASDVDTLAKYLK